MNGSGQNSNETVHEPLLRAGSRGVACRHVTHMVAWDKSHQKEGLPSRAWVAGEVAHLKGAGILKVLTTLPFTCSPEQRTDAIALDTATFEA